jgi:hypothetical protein
MSTVYVVRLTVLVIILISTLPTGLSFVKETGKFGRSGRCLSPNLKPASESIIRNIIIDDDATSLQMSSSSSSDTSQWANRLLEESKEVASCASLVLSAIFLSSDKVEAEEIVKICDEIDDAISTTTTSDELFVSKNMQLRTRALKMKRYDYLAKLMQKDYDAYVATANFLSPSRITRRELPNLQDIDVLPIDNQNNAIQQKIEVTTSEDSKIIPLVDDCELDDLKYKDNPLDILLLAVFRKLVTKNTGGVTSDKPGIDGLVEQARTFMLQQGHTPEAQHKMVKDTLADLMTPVLPPFYRIFMSGIVPKVGTEWDGKQIGPWFYAPWLTTIITPTFFGFLVGPSYPNRRKDGKRGGLVVEKCKFLQESGCKGICLHDCKLPTQQFFQDELGLPLTVIPNFVTQECQWSFGETPVPPSEDESFPKGCLVGCESRKVIAASGSTADACN